MPKPHSEQALIRRLAAPRANLERLAREAQDNPAAVKALIAALDSPVARVKFGACKVLRILSESAPETVHPHFDVFVRLLDHPNSILKWNAMLVLGNLAGVDREGKLDAIIQHYLAPIAGPEMIAAGNAMRGAAAIALARPHLAEAIATGILCVEQASYKTRECRNVAIGHAIGALERFYGAISDKRAVQMFVSRQLKNPRAATAGKARKFLARFPIQQAAAAT